jgi:hypothetical protein
MNNKIDEMVLPFDTLNIMKLSARFASLDF